MKCLIFLAGAVLMFTAAPAGAEAPLNERPIIGILSQEQSIYLHTKFPEENYTSYIASSYVKSVEAAGGRVVPILIGKNRTYYDEMLQKINGVLFPGGATYFNQSNGYADAGQTIFEIAKHLNDQGDYFPIMGTCLGFQLLTIITSKRDEGSRVGCWSMDVNLPLEFTEDFRSSKMFVDAPENIVKILATENVTLNAHQFCVTRESLKKYKLTDQWRPISFNHDDYGKEFISTFEHKRYPFYGIQFHSEKNSYEWKLSKRIAHSPNAIYANRYFTDFFVQEARKSHHAFASAVEENEYLIYNWPPKFTGVLGSAHHQCHFFEPRGKAPCDHQST